ncbi:coiled-coil domain-containing protein 122 [Pleurodeles waltl]|uniref:coiled-coil domain-containing protein 122 n=1 Tax=Pleurodeles waltl TaxID=8319 RepID=UPI0037097C29
MTILAETKKTEKEIYQKDDEIETTNLNCEYLVTHNQSVYADNVRIKFNLEERKEDFEALLSRNTAYRERMASHIQVFSEIESKLPIMNELLEKKDAINNLKRRKEELLIELENPDGNVIKQVQAEIETIKEEITGVRQAIDDHLVLLEEEKKVHARLTKEIEVQNKRYEAILKRLHCQLNKVQLSNRQRKWNIQQMEKTVAELKKCLGMTE